MRERESERERRVFVSESGNDWGIQSNSKRRDDLSSSHLARERIHALLKEQKRTHCKVGTMPDGCTDRSIPPSVVSGVAFSVATMGKGAAPSSFGGFVI